MADDRIEILESPISRAVLERLVQAHFHDMVKFVVDVERRMIAVGGEMHAEAEQRLLEAGSKQSNLWGANYYPGRGPNDCLEFTSLINISPRRGNRTMEVQDDALRDRIRAIVLALIGCGEEVDWPPTTPP